VYPYHSVVRGAPSIEDNDVLANPSVLVEVLSPSTEQYDRGLKWEGYRLLPSLTDYLLVSQDRAEIEHFARAGSGRWIYMVAGSGERVRLTDGTDLEVDPIFEGVFALPGG
jgi:Uma2 family endonuclease